MYILSIRQFDGEVRAVILKLYYMPNSLTSIIHNKILPNFQAFLGKMNELSNKNVVKKNLTATAQIE